MLYQYQMLQNYTMQYWAYIALDRRYTWVISPELFGKWAEKERQRSWSQSSQSPERRVSHISSTYPKQLVCSLSFSCFFLRNTAPIALNYLLVFWRLQRTLLQSIKGRLREKCSTLGKSLLIAFHKWSSQVPQLTEASGLGKLCMCLHVNACPQPWFYFQIYEKGCFWADSTWSPPSHTRSHLVPTRDGHADISALSDICWI